MVLTDRLSGVGFGLYLILIRRAGEHGVFWPLAVARASSVAAILTLTIPLGKFRLPKGGAGFSMASGVLDVGGVASFLIAARMGRLDVTAVLASLYPVVTVLLARAVLHERVHRSQELGIALALGGIVLISAG